MPDPRPAPRGEIEGAYRVWRAFVWGAWATTLAVCALAVALGSVVLGVVFAVLDTAALPFVLRALGQGRERAWQDARDGSRPPP
jgi:hypothetical protein